MGKGGKDTKTADKGGKGGKGKGAEEKDAGKSKGAQSINVRHILCEKHSKKEEALAKLRDGAKFDEVAREFSEDKARQGEMEWMSHGSVTETDMSYRRCSRLEDQGKSGSPVRSRSIRPGDEYDGQPQVRGS
jgi:hypothetical protein